MKQTLTCVIAVILVCPCIGRVAATERSEVDGQAGARPGRIIDPNSADILDRAGVVLSDPNAATVEVLAAPGVKDTPSVAMDWDRVQLSLSGATDLPEFKYRLLPLARDLTDDDAAVLYAQAAEALSEEIDMDIISEWISMPVDELPVEEVEAVVEKLETTFKLLDKAARCRSCKWLHADKLSPPIEFLDRMKTFTGILSLRTRLQIAQKQYKDAAHTIQTGLAMARHIADSPTIVQALVGQATASVMLKQVEEFVQSPGAPSLYRAFQDLPRPLINLGKILEYERQLQYRLLLEERGPMEWDPWEYRGVKMYSIDGKMMMRPIERPDIVVPEPAYSRERLRVLALRMNRLVAALECIEGIRLQGALNGGQLPLSLDDITDISLRPDPVTDCPFFYFVRDGLAVLEAPRGTGVYKGIEPLRFVLELK